MQHWNNLVIKMYIFFHLVWVDQAAKCIVCEIHCKAIIIWFIGEACFEKSRNWIPSEYMILSFRGTHIIIQARINAVSI